MGSAYRVITRHQMVKEVTIDEAVSSDPVLGEPVDFRSLSKGAFDLQWTGAGTGLFTLEASIDHDPDKLDPNGTWTLQTLGIPSPSGAAGNVLVSLIDLAFPFYRIVYTPATGAIVLNVWVSGKT